MTKTLTAIALATGLLVGAGAAYAQSGGYYNWAEVHGPSNYAGVAAETAGTPLASVHPNALYQYQPGAYKSGKTAKPTTGTIFADSPNRYAVVR